MNVLSLCSGIGGLDLGIKLADPTARTVCYVEWEPYAACVLAERMAEGSLDSCPIYCDDLRRFDAKQWVGVVDCVVAGFPCQPHSVAGKMRGVDDARDLSGEVVRVARETAARFVFAENVTERAIELVGFGLERMGYRVSTITIRASDLGAPHHRRRCFLFADANSIDVQIEHRGCDWQGWAREVFPAVSDWWAREPGMDRLDNGTPWRVDALRSLGNAVVPQQAALAYRVLSERIRAL